MPPSEPPDPSPSPETSDTLAAELGALEAMLGARPDEPAASFHEASDGTMPPPDEEMQ